MDAYRNFVEFAELSSIGLTAKKIGRIHNGCGMRLRVETGSVWITEERSQEDVCLKAGESYCIKHDGMTLISTLRVPFALVSLEPTLRPPRLRWASASGSSGPGCTRPSRARPAQCSSTVWKGEPPCAFAT